MALSKSEILYEYGKCLQDPIYTIESFMSTYDATKPGFVPFKLFPKQKELVDSYRNNRFNIVMKPRQAGISTTTAAYIAVLVALANKDTPQKVLILANKQDTAMEFLKKVKDFVLQLPDWMGVDFDPEKNSAKHFRLINGSEVKAVATSIDALRGFTPTLLVMDEAAFIDGGEEVYAAAQPALSTGGGAILISTPNGHDPLYYTTYKTAKDGNNPFNIVEMRWYQDPRYNQGIKLIMRDEDSDDIIETIDDFDLGTIESFIKKGYQPTSPWYENMCGQLNHNKRKINQELNCAFLGSGDNVIEDKYIRKQERENVCDPIREEFLDRKMWVWKDPILEHQYILSSDPARGDAGDFASIVITDFDEQEQVAEYQGKMKPDALGELIFEYANRYNAYVVIDITGGIGVATVLKLIDLGFPLNRMHYDTPLNTNDQQMALDKYIRGGKMPGLNINKNRSLIIQKFEMAIRMGTYKVRSVRAISEMETFVFKNGRPDHMKGHHDDIIFSIAMSIYVGEISFKELERNTNQAKAMLAAWVVNTTTTDGPQPMMKPITDGSQPQQPPRNIPNDGSYNWLFSGMI